MNITLNQNEIEEALVGYISEQGIDVGGKDITIDLIAGRGENGHKATIELIQAERAASVNLTDAQVAEDLPETTQESPVEVVNTETNTVGEILEAEEEIVADGEATEEDDGKKKSLFS